MASRAAGDHAHDAGVRCADAAGRPHVHRGAGRGRDPVPHRTDGQGGGSVGFAFFLRDIWIDPIEYGQRELRYVPVSPTADITVSAAKRLRRHVMQDLASRRSMSAAASLPRSITS